MSYSPIDKRYLTVADVLTSDGQNSVRIILDTDTNLFYTLDADDNFEQIGNPEFTETVTYISAAEVASLGSTAKDSTLVLTGNNYLNGNFQVVYQATNNPWDINPNADGNDEIYLVAHLSSVYNGNIFDGVLFRANLALMASTYKSVAQGVFSVPFPDTYLPIALPQNNGTVKFTMIDKAGAPIDISDLGEVCGGLKVIMNTKVQSFA